MLHIRQVSFLLKMSFLVTIGIAFIAFGIYVMIRDRKGSRPDMADSLQKKDNKGAYWIIGIGVILILISGLMIWVRYSSIGGRIGLTIMAYVFATVMTLKGLYRCIIKPIKRKMQMSDCHTVEKQIGRPVTVVINDVTGEMYCPEDEKAKRKKGYVYGVVGLITFYLLISINMI